MKANQKLWEHKAKQILKRDEPQQEDNSNPDDTDLPDGGGGGGGAVGFGSNNIGNDVRVNDVEKEKT